MTTKETIYTKIWDEEPEPNNPFAASSCYCHGYNVYEDILLNASWTEYLYLIFTGKRPNKKQAVFLERMAVAIAHPGIRDASVRAAMNGGVGGSTWAACLTAALSVGAGQYTGAHEVAIIVDAWERNVKDLAKWKDFLLNPNIDERADIWPKLEHAPGFDPNGETCPTPIIRTLDLLTSLSTGDSLLWLKENRKELEKVCNYPLAMTGVIATAMHDLRFNSNQAELLFLFLRLPGAAAHAIEQNEYGWRKYPFFKDAVVLTNDPGHIQIKNNHEQ